MTAIVRVSEQHIPQLAPLFDLYRIFYGQVSNLDAAANFLQKRLSRNESIIYMAFQGNKAVGFTQLYPSFSSVSMKPILILNDLYVLKEYRKKGVGESLMNRAKEFCQEGQFKGLALETAIDNPAQELYERLGWQKDVHCFHYFWTA
tara:strand:+ start:4332 stop:4772 length:441 start_codon:yes stop_codon:yes gene_type:complete